MLLGKQCLCCKNCTECQEFKKFIRETGFEIYLYIKNKECVSSNYDLLEHQGFVFKNVQDFTIHSEDLLGKIDSSEFTCQRCKAILKQVANVLKGTSVKKNEIVVICDCCISEKITCAVEPCQYCQKIYDKLNATSSLQDDTAKTYTEKWVSQIGQILDSKRETQKRDTLRKIPDEINKHKFQSSFSSQHIHKEVELEPLPDVLKIDTKSLSDLKKEPNDTYTNISYSSPSSPPQKVQLKFETKPLTDVLKIDTQSLDEFADLDLEKTEEIKKDVPHLLDSPSSHKLDGAYDGFESLTNILKTVSRETFRYVFPKADTREYDLKENISSSELLKDILLKVNLTKEEQKEKLGKALKVNLTKEEQKEKLGKAIKQAKKGKHILIHTTSDEEKESAVTEVRSGRSMGKIPHKSDNDKLLDDQSGTSLDTKIKKRRKMPQEIGDKPDRTKRKTDNEIPLDKEEKKVKESKKRTELKPTNNDLSVEIDKMMKQKPLSKKDVEESGDGLLMTTKKVSKEVLKRKMNKDEEESSRKQKKKDEDSKTKISDSLTKAIRDAKDKIKSPNESKGVTKKTVSENNKPTLPENLNLNQVNIKKTSMDDIDIKMMVNQDQQKKVIKSDLYILPPISKPPKIEKTLSTTEVESDSDIDIDELQQLSRLSEVNEIIIGQKILKHKVHFIDKIEKIKEVQPLYFESTFNDIDMAIDMIIDKDTDKNIDKNISKHIDKKITVPKGISTSKYLLNDPDALAKGTVRYALSNRSFIDKGWTMLPTEKIVRKLNVYRMRPSHPEFDWFEHNKSKKVMYYDTGEMLAEFHEDGRGRWFYRNGRLALDYYNAEEMNAGQRYVVYSNGEPDEKGCSRPITVLATFDYLGNGIVFDHTGKIRLKYNQTEGVVLDKGIGPVSHWKWHELNDPPVLQKVMIDTQMAVKDPEILKIGGSAKVTPRADNEEMLAIEFDNFIKEKSKKLSQKFKPFQIKMKALKINENFSLRVLDQASVYLSFRDGPTNLKLNLGMILDHKEIVDTDTAEVGEVSCNVERFPARTDSLAVLQRSVAHAQYVEKLRIERERRFKVTEATRSIDRLTAAVSRPLQPAVRTVPDTECYCNVRNPPTCS